MRKSLAVIVLFAAACATTPTTETHPSGVTVTNEESKVASCYDLGYFPEEMTMLSLHPVDVWAKGVKQRGGDTLLRTIVGSRAYACGPDKVKTFKERDAKRAAVRITNRQDVVAQCKFLKNETVESEGDARARTVDAGGTVFFVVSDTTRTAQQTDTSSLYTRHPTTYNYEVRRLTGEVYSCQ